MSSKWTRAFGAILFMVAAIIFAACSTDADVASRNLSKNAEDFTILRRVVFYNGVTGDYILTLTGNCSIEDEGHKLEVTCKVGDGKYIKNYLGLSDNVTYFVEQLRAEKVSTYRYEVVFKPESVLPDFDFQHSGQSVDE